MTDSMYSIIVSILITCSIVGMFICWYMPHIKYFFKEITKLLKKGEKDE